MLLFRKLFRGAKVVWAFAYSTLELLVTRPQKRADRAAWLSGLCRRILRAVDITWTAAGPIPTQGAVISNHLTYVDILLHAAMRPCVFVSAIEVRRMPVFGWLSMMAGTVYVKRGVGGSAAKAAGGMAEGFRDGLPIVFFPEGGTSVGDVPLLPLHSGLLANALEVGATVTPGFIRYQINPQDAADGKTARNDIAWGDQTLPAHLWNLLGLRPFNASIDFATAPIPFSQEAYTDRKLAAKEARQAILMLVPDPK